MNHSQAIENWYRHEVAAELLASKCVVAMLESEAQMREGLILAVRATSVHDRHCVEVVKSIISTAQSQQAVLHVPGVSRHFAREYSVVTERSFCLMRRRASDECAYGFQQTTNAINVSRCALGI